MPAKVLHIIRFLSATLLLILYCCTLCAQRRYEQWKHPVFNQIVHQRNEWHIYENSCKGCWVNLAAVHKNSNVLYFLNRAGSVHDSILLNTDEWRQIVEPALITPFQFMQRHIEEDLHKAEALKERIRNNTGKKLNFYNKPGQPENPLVKALQKARYPLEQLLAVDASTVSRRNARACFTYNLYKQPVGEALEAQTAQSALTALLRRADSGLVVFENPDQFSILTHAVINVKTGRALVFEADGRLTDSFALNTKNIEALKKAILTLFTCTAAGWKGGCTN